MINPSPLLPENRSLDEQFYDLWGAFLLETETRNMLKEIASAPKDETCTVQDKRNLKRIHSYFSRQRFKTFFTQRLPRTLRTAAVLLAALIIAGGVAIATSKDLRKGLLELLIKEHPQYTTISSNDPVITPAPIPEGWNGYAYPTFIPEGFDDGRVLCSLGFYTAAYLRTDTGSEDLTFSEYTEGFSINLDTENALIESVAVNHCSATLIQKKGLLTLYWNDGQRLYLITYCGGSREEILFIADSVRPVE